MPDAPSSPRKVVSSASTQARSQKKPGAPKPKGAVRAKSGCYTCRIRRKKCDEQPNDDGACQTCVRLRLQCLGFGAKRPEWMRENNSVTELREKIKSFLASQGMIKGHSGSGPRSTDQDPPVLVLVDSLHTSPSSPPTPTLSATSSSEGPRPPHNGMNTSFERAPAHYTTMPPEQQQYGHNWQPAIPELGHDPAMNRGPMLPNVNELMYHPPAPAPQPQPQPAPTMIQSPTSILAQSYNIDPNTFSDDDVDQSASPEGAQMPMPVVVSGLGLAIPSEQGRLIQHYLARVLPIQYLLADDSIKHFMIRLIQTSSEARDAACVLSALHLSLSYPAQTTDANLIFNRVQTAVANRRTQYTEGDAMAGLHIVSSFLFSGGRGDWAFWLGIACEYVQALLDSPLFYGPEDALRKCPESTRFIIKTTMWFDVLASVTTQTVPRFLETYRQLFSTQGAYIGDPAASAPEISMLPVMGCENKIVLAIAEISNLAHWKENHLHRGTLSIPDLVHRGADIEERLLGPSSPQPLAVPLQPGMYGPQALQHPVSMYAQHAGGGGATEAEVVQRRRLTNDIFRASAKVYLHTVLSGDYPACPEIVAAVTETIDALSRIPMDAPSVHRSVVRSVVFGICISGCLTDDHRQRNFLIRMLEYQQRESVGNVGEVKRLMQNVWEQRDADRDSGRYRPTDWRRVMRESNPDLLLLV
ncbi:Transcriptional regulatory protein pro1 [Trametes pubescens]|uniref:Transcriptional regulatory protein pro1 n=1 Tax=Trametes pubescens TaxID=154538 RepID=A0A1M2V3W5_TRAPU|nr:Transcriptional regulatory protein pro1 [Trametes pubescens]